MAFNRFMHPRNMYKTKPPNFSELAEKYPEFRKFCTTDCSGKVSVNFKESEAVRALTRALLLENFQLDVELPPDSLVPRVPQRLNYILWIEDMLLDNQPPDSTSHHNPNEPSVKPVTGIDIGTGASCVYPLLGAKQCSWNFIATDKDPEAVAYARRNVQKNSLEDKIEVVEVSEKTAICAALDQDSKSRKFDFSMCNPPFYDLTEVTDHESGFLRCCTSVDSSENSTGKKSRSDPHSNTVAKQSEVCAEGGEFAFVSRIIDDSAILRRQIRIYTSMVGKKANLGPLKAKLRSVGVASLSQTVFCQGKTQRWALAWTFDPGIKLNVKSANLPDSNSASAKPRKNPSYKLEFPESFRKTEAATVELLNLLDEIRILHKKVPDDSTGKGDGSSLSGAVCKFECECYENTWSNQRRKRRKRQRAEEGEEPRAKKSRLDHKQNGSKHELHNGSNGLNDTTGCSLLGTDECTNGCKDPKSGFLLKFMASVGTESYGKIYASLDWVEGENKDHLHQILQYLRNSLSSKHMNGNVKGVKH